MRLHNEKWLFPKEDENTYLIQSYKRTVSNVEGPITDFELLKVLKTMLNNKLPGNDGLMKNNYTNFWK